jgi:RimJ/RimL family protein N-acetyltransferase
VALAADDGSVETRRLLLRRWRRDDFDDLAAVFAKPEVWWSPAKRGWTGEETRDFLDRKFDEWESRGWSHWAVEHKPDQRLIGFLGLQPPAWLPEVMPTVEIGWRLDPDYWGKGLATEGGRAGLEFGFKVLGLDEIVSIPEPANVASCRVAEHLGMFVDRETMALEFGVTVRVYKMTRESWRGGAGSVGL